MLQEIGMHFCETIIEYVNVDDKTVQQMVQEIDDMIQNANQNEKTQ